MIELNRLTKKYEGIAAVNDVCLKIEKEERVAIVGPSGSGKTTLLRMIAGLEVPDAGEIRINGKNAGIQDKIIIPPHKRGIGMIFQDLALWSHMTVMENLEFGLKCQKVKKAERKAKIERISDMIKINGYLNRYPQYLSGGEKQRAALARTILLEPEILLMDEPFSGLDTVLKNEIQYTILRLVKELKLVMIYVTHDREEALAMADKIVVMVNGSVIQTGNIKELSENPKTDFVEKFMRNI